jgi:FkbM family methyltransferase
MPETPSDARLSKAARKYGYYLKSIFQLIVEFAPLGRILALFTGLASEGTYIVALRRWGLRFEARSAMDVWSLKETFVDRFYERYSSPVGEPWVVVDIGGGIGDFSIFAAHRRPGNRVYAFEPFPGSFALLRENLKRNQISNVQAFQQAIWSGRGSLALDTSTGEPVQFISRELDEAAAGGDTVPCDSLENTFARLDIQRCDLLKVDAEGAEYAILFNTPEAVLAKIQRIVMEYHDAITPHTHAELAAFLSEKGYRVAAVENVVHPELGYLYAER